MQNNDIDNLISDIARLSRELLEANLLLRHVWELAVCADSELSAIAHGRPPSTRDELLRLSHAFRELYEKRIPKPRKESSDA